MLRTEKGTNQSVMGKYSFLVAKDANKIDIKSAVEHIYKVKVESVNTMVNYGKRKRVRFA
jgi:large subunit ribosomal protein L23